MSRPSPLRAGVACGGVCGGAVVPAWQAACVEALLAVDGVELALVLVETAAPRRAGGGADEAGGGGALWRLYDRRVVRTRSAALRSVDLAGRLAPLGLRFREVGPLGGPSPLDPGTIAELRTAALDVLVRLAPGPVPDEVLAVPRHGVWAFRYGRAGWRPGNPPGLREVCEGEATTRAALCRLIGGAGGAAVLREGVFKTVRYSYVRTLDRVCLGSAAWPAAALRELAAGGRPDRDAEPEPAPPAGSRPTGARAARLALAAARSGAARALEHLFVRDQWNVGIVDAPIHAFLSPGFRPRVRWLPRPPRHRLVADPFGIRLGERTVVLVEEYDHRSRRGRISAIESADGRAFGPPRPVIEGPVHMSYPYLFTYRGGVYCVPETHEAREVALYRADRDLTRWDRVGTLLEGIAALDATLIEHGGRWWLFCTDEDAGAQTALHLFHAQAPLGPWTPHRGNPVKTDVRASRPAGTPFVHGGSLYRPAQDSSETYGGAVTLNRVVRLTPQAFREEPVAAVRPDPDGPFPHGLHTVSAAGDVTLVDGKRRVVTPSAALRVVASSARGLAAPVGGRLAPAGVVVAGGEPPRAGGAGR